MSAAASADLGAYWIFVTENFVGFIWFSSLSIWSGPRTDMISCAVGIRLMFPILGAEYPAKPKAGAAELVAPIALEPSMLGSVEALSEFGRAGSLRLFMFNLLRDWSIGFAIAPCALGGAGAGSIPKLTGLAAVLTGCNSAGSFIGDA